MSTIKEKISAAAISLRVKELALLIQKDYATSDELVVICVLSGAYTFCADLLRDIDHPHINVQFIKVSSYGDGTVSSENIKIEYDLRYNIENKDVLLIEDIVDTGLTMHNLFKNLSDRKAKSLKLASLLFKPSRKKVEVNIDYLGFEIEDFFVIGYGLDYANQYRNLPFLGELINEK